MVESSKDMLSDQDDTFDSSMKVDTKEKREGNQVLKEVDQNSNNI